MSESIQQSEPKRFQCRHILTNGNQCRAVCLRGEDFCYFHHTTRRPIANPTERKGRRASFTLPLVEDRASIQLAIAQILCRIASNDLDPRRAGLLLYGLQIASINLPRLPTPTAQSEPEPTVEEVIQHPDHGPIAPQQDFATRPTSNGKKDLEQILMEQWAREEQQDREQSDPEQAANTPFILENLQAATEAPTLPYSLFPIPCPHPGDTLTRDQNKLPATISAINSHFLRPPSTPASVVRKYIPLTRPSTLTRFPASHARASFPTPRTASPAAHSFSTSAETRISSVRPRSLVYKHRPSSTRGAANIFTSVFAAPPSTFSAVPTVSHGQLTCAAPTRHRQSAPTITSHFTPSYPQP